jgi:protease YdgD
LDADQGLLVHDCDTNPGASGSAIFGQFTDGNYYIVGLHAGSNQLRGSVKLPDGVVTQAINQGVQVSQWATQALSMRR